MWNVIRKKPRKTRTMYMFDTEKLAELESLTPRQVVDLLCMAQGQRTESAMLFQCYESWDSLMKPIEVEV